jgi:hypothetical protein
VIDKNVDQLNNNFLPIFSLLNIIFNKLCFNLVRGRVIVVVVVAVTVDVAFILILFPNNYMLH